MINKEKLLYAIDEYKKSFETRWQDEKFKWVAVKWFQEHWDISAEDFAAMFMSATEKTETLLVSMNNFPRSTMQYYAQKEPETVRKMFVELFDNEKPVSDRIMRFQSDSQDLCNRLSPGKSHYQRPMAITVYLWMMFPDTYGIYKYSISREAAKFLENDFIPKKGNASESVNKNNKMIDEMVAILHDDKELTEMLTAHIDETCYSDESLRILAFDVCHFITYTLVPSLGNEDTWLFDSYESGITKEKWKELLANPDVFTKQGLEIVCRMKDYGGQATCSQLAVKYGETTNFYNMGSTGLAKRILEYVGCKPCIGSDGKERNWPILYVGKNADKSDVGVFVWKLRNELSQAIDEMNLSNVLLYSTDSENEKKYWWLNANPKIWSFADIAVGEVQSYTLYNDNGNKRRVFQNFLDAKAGDIVIGYESHPVKKIVAIAKIAQENDGKNLYFEKVEGLSVPIDYSILKDIPELQNMEYFVSPQGSLFRLTKGEYELIMDLIREDNPLSNEDELETYTKENFVDEVYMYDGMYDVLKNLLLNKKNIILQGAPGVGKTFAARRLAYSIIGKKDDDKIEFVQFHQNYTYEDFIMGYRPSGEGFELKNGIFYRFCQKAANNPDKSYFFIIDEINRGNMSKIFGELLMLIEKDYRGTKMTLAYNGLTFSVPENLYIIGMMNTADRSLAMIDYALRRRFSFYSMEPGFTTDGFRKYMMSFKNDTFVALIDKVIDLNTEIEKDPTLGSGFCIGHSYFCGQKECTDEWLQQVVEYDILPMLNEYWFDEPNKYLKWHKILEGVFSE